MRRERADRDVVALAARSRRPRECSSASAARRDDAAVVTFLERRDAAGVVVMMMGDQDIGELPAGRLERGFDRRRLRRVDRGGGAASPGSCTQNAEIVLQAEKQAGLGGHGDALRRCRYDVDREDAGRSSAFAALPQGSMRPASFHASFSAMSLDVVDLRNFYGQRLGMVARRFVGRGIRARCGATRAACACSASAMPTPYLGLFREEAERCLAFMPAAQGVVKWPTDAADAGRAGRRIRVAAARRRGRPRAAGACAGNDARRGRRCCARRGACWRRGGRLLAVVPNRRGLWARMDTTPFGHGRPYSRSQIKQLLRETWFTPTGWSEALYVPPVARGWFLRSAVAWERTGATLSAPFAGVHIVEATKQVYRAIPARREKQPAGAGAGAGAGAVAAVSRVVPAEWPVGRSDQRLRSSIRR